MTRPKWRRVLQRRLIAGLVVMAPLAATIWVLTWLFQLLDGIIGRVIYRAIGAVVGRERFVVPGLGLLALFLLLYSMGWVAERTIGRRMIAWWHDLLERVPIVRRIYGTTNRIVRTVFGNEAKPFTTVVVAEWPSAGRWSIGFLTGDAPVQAREHGGDDMVSVFIPTTPNPTTGFLVMMKRTSVFVVQMTVDEAFTLILSGGAVSPTVASTGAAQPDAAVGPAVL